MSARDFLGIGLAYALGSLCAGYYLVRWRTGRDVRLIGSASAGARNAGRLLGPGGFALVLAFDLLKGIAAVVVAVACSGWATPRWHVVVVAVVVGHVLPVQLGFRGGKGVAPSIGALLAYDAWVVLGSAAIAGLSYVMSGRRLVRERSGRLRCSLLVTGLALRRPILEVAALASRRRGGPRRASREHPKGARRRGDDVMTRKAVGPTTRPDLPDRDANPGSSSRSTDSTTGSSSRRSRSILRIRSAGSSIL